MIGATKPRIPLCFMRATGFYGLAWGKGITPLEAVLSLANRLSGF
jgi:hypothetical protein